FHMANDSSLFSTRAELEASGHTLIGNRYTGRDGEFLPLIEGKMIHHFDHRFGTYQGQTQAQANQGKLPELNDQEHADPDRTSLPEYWLPRVEVEERIGGVSNREWLLGWRDITGTEKQRTVIASIVPRVAAGHTFPLMFSALDARQISYLYCSLCTHV